MAKKTRLFYYTVEPDGKNRKDTSIRMVGRDLLWKRGELKDSYITIFSVFDHEKVVKSHKYEDSLDGIAKAQEYLDDLADKRGFKIKGENAKLPEREVYPNHTGHLLKM